VALTAADLIAFENRVAEEFEAGKISGPVHLSGGNEEELIRVFEEVDSGDWVFCSYRNHYHALLHGLDPEWVMSEIRAGRSMYLASPEKRFFSSAIVGGCLPIAVGVAAALQKKDDRKRVWCFVGDMASLTGAYEEARLYSSLQALRITFVVEDNGLSCDSPTEEVWGKETPQANQVMYQYKRTWPHVGTGKFVKFPGF
jgi:TPP-dependent pyruvate/acetoin dehydrogenase alpha subunit